MVKKIKSERGERKRPLSVRGLSLFLSIIILFCSCPLISFADDLQSVSVYRDYSLNDIGNMLSIIHEEMTEDNNNLYTLVRNHHERIVGLFNDLNTKIDDDYIGLKNHLNAINANINDKQADLYNQSNSHFSSIMTTFTNIYSGGDYSLKNVYEYLTGYNREHLNAINANINDKFFNMQSVMDTESKNIQDNADKNTQQQIDNSNTNHQEQINNDNENTSKIGGFFDKLFDNISNFLKSLFMPSDDYFDNLRADLDVYLTEHLGAVYQFPAVMLEQVTTMYNSIKNENMGYYFWIDFPELSFTLNKQKYVIMNATAFNLFDFMVGRNSMPSQFQKNFNTAVKIMHAIIDISLCAACFKMIYKKVINKAGIERGSDL